MIRKLKAIWHIIISDKFLCFTYEDCSAYETDYMQADKIYVDKNNISRYFFDSIDEFYKYEKNNVKATF